nr:MAG TPA: polyA polymerase [Caudoviricetes sp.]
MIVFYHQGNITITLYLHLSVSHILIDIIFYYSRFDF